MQILKIVVLCCVLLLPLGSLHAQEEEPTTPPLIFTSAGDLWRVDIKNAIPEKFTDWGYNNAPILNEATGLVAYNSLAQVWVDAIAAGEGMSGSMASNIWVIDPVTVEAFRPADQPADASITEGIFTLRSDPTWSPDGTKLAWSEYALHDTAETYNIGIFDSASGETRIFELPETSYYGIPGPVGVLWSHDGEFLAVTYAQWNGTTSSAANVVDFYDPAMTLVTHVELPEDFAFDNRLWLNHLGSTQLGIYVGATQWLIVNPLTGEVSGYYGAVYGSVQHASEVGLRLVFENDEWSIEFPAATTQRLDYAPSVYLFTNITLDPTSRYVAFTEPMDTLVVLDFGEEMIRLPMDDIIQGLSWSNLVWETDATSAPDAQG